MCLIVLFLLFEHFHLRQAGILFSVLHSVRNCVVLDPLSTLEVHSYDPSKFHCNEPIRFLSVRMKPILVTKKYRPVLLVCDFSTPHRTILEVVDLLLSIKSAMAEII